MVPRETREIRKEPEPEFKSREIRRINKPDRTPEFNQPKRRGKNRYRLMLWFLASISLLFCLFAVSFIFSNASVSVNPKTKDVTLNENLSANKDSNGNGLSFSLVVLPGQESRSVQASGEKDVQKAATGTVKVYNDFSTSPQVLSIDTRLEGSNGKIYKLASKVTIPGIDKKGIPGSVEANIYAAGVGPDYNSPPLDFNIAGFKNTAKYSKIFAKSDSPISGGFSGKMAVVTDADQMVALGELKSALQTDLLQKVVSQVPGGFILFKDAAFLDVNTADMTSVYNNDGTATISLPGTLYGILLNKQELARKIATDMIDGYDGSDVYIPSFNNMTFSLTNKDNTSFNDSQNINFTLTGTAEIVWRLDTNKFINDLISIPKGTFNQVLLKYPNISSATLKVTPMWRTTIPDDIKKVKVIVNYPS